MMLKKMDSFSSISKILTDTTRSEWINMSYDDFVKTVVEPLNMMGHDSRKRIINGIDYPQFEMLTSKCWDAQDIQPTEDTYDNEEEFEEPYDRVLPILVLLEDVLSIRIEVEPTMDRKNTMAKQLALLNVILQPHLFEDMADKINEKRNAK